MVWVFILNKRLLILKHLNHHRPKQTLIETHVVLRPMRERRAPGMAAVEPLHGRKHFGVSRIGLRAA